MVAWLGQVVGRLKSPGFARNEAHGLIDPIDRVGGEQVCQLLRLRSVIETDYCGEPLDVPPADPQIERRTGSLP